jgi:hypothetical protein
MIEYEADGHLGVKKALGNNNDWYAHIQGKTDTEMRATYRETTRNNENYQLWDILYVDAAGEADSGFAADWGFEIGREFHIISSLCENRYVDLVSNRAVIKTPNGRDSQIFKFDMITKTIKSQGYSTAWSHSLDIRNQWMYVYGTNSANYQVFRYNQEDGTIRTETNKFLDI